MVIKRKRSDSEISTSSSLLSSPLSNSDYMSIDSYPSNQSIATPSLFSSRTRKRYRDNRPSETEVHEHTLSLLFSAQQQRQHTPTPPAFQSSYPLPKPISSLPSSQPRQQSNLHTFWHGPMGGQASSHSSNSPSAPSSTANTPNLVPRANYSFPATNCEDCDASLSEGSDVDAMDVDMMMDVDTEEGNHACTSCGKQVCRSCAVSNLGARRQCLGCAGRQKAW